MQKYELLGFEPIIEQCFLCLDKKSNPTPIVLLYALVRFNGELCRIEINGSAHESCIHKGNLELGFVEEDGS